MSEWRTVHPTSWWYRTSGNRHFIFFLVLITLFIVLTIIHLPPAHLLILKKNYNFHANGWRVGGRRYLWLLLNAYGYLQTAPNENEQDSDFWRKFTFTLWWVVWCSLLTVFMEQQQERHLLFYFTARYASLLLAPAEVFFFAVFGKKKALYDVLAYFLSFLCLIATSVKKSLKF